MDQRALTWLIDDILASTALDGRELALLQNLKRRLRGEAKGEVGDDDLLLVANINHRRFAPK